MWQSQDDIVTDLAALNDFGRPEDKEPYKVLYSIGRGSKLKEKNKTSEKFLDSRTGEIIDAEDEIIDNDYCYKGRGRGSLLGGFLRSKFQLQQQLRLARPLGSGDEAIESYCRRNQPIKNARNPVLDSEMESAGGQITEKHLKSNLNLDRMKHRVKAVRNSSTDSNALINGLLNKRNKKSETQLTCKEGNFPGIDEENSDRTLNFNNVIVNSSDNGGTVGTSCNEFSTERSSLNNLSDVDEFLEAHCSGKTACLKDTFSSSDKTQKSNKLAQVISVETLDYFKKERGNEEINEIKDSKNYSENSFYDSAEVQQERNEKYRMLGEKLNRLRKIDPKTSESGIYDFSEISRCIAPIDTDSDANSAVVVGSNPVPTYFVVKDEDFPPLLNGSLKPLD